MPSKLGSYDHMNPDSALTIKIPMEQLVKDVVELNYGAHRLLSALVRELREHQKDRLYQDGSPLADGIEELLNQGLYY
jgi:hypothetical protein